MAKSTADRKRPDVPLKDFLRVVIVQRDKFPTAESAATELGLKLSSFNQRFLRERKNYPDIFKDVQLYGTRGRHVASLDEAASMLAELQAELTPDADETVAE